VKDAIENAPDNIFKELKNQGFGVNYSSEKETLFYDDINNQMQEIVDTAISKLAGYGIHIGDVKVFKFYHPFIHCGGINGQTGWVVDYVKRVQGEK
ncbi:MAG: hypothetical protein R3232_12120, partial [Clostridia bacterium]|nr:hypothetical protein [Clostridia bacterium]